MVKLVPGVRAEIKPICSFAEPPVVHVTPEIVAEASFNNNIWLLPVTAVVSTTRFAFPLEKATLPALAEPHAAGDVPLKHGVVNIDGAQESPRVHVAPLIVIDGLAMPAFCSVLLEVD